jgi:hypothetical protein
MKTEPARTRQTDISRTRLTQRAPASQTQCILCLRFVLDAAEHIGADTHADYPLPETHLASSRTSAPSVARTISSRRMSAVNDARISRRPTVAPPHGRHTSSLTADGPIPATIPGARESDLLCTGIPEPSVPLACSRAWPRWACHLWSICPRRRSPCFEEQPTHEHSTTICGPSERPAIACGGSNERM